MSRISSIYNGTLRRQDTPSTQTTSHDQFPLLNIQEITFCLLACEITVTEEQIARPTNAFVKELYGEFCDQYMGTPIPEVQRRIAQGKRKKLKKLQDTSKKTTNIQERDNDAMEVENGDREDEEMEGQQINEDDNEYDDEDEDLIHLRDLYVLYAATERFMQICGIGNFTLLDILRPDPFRTRRILSAVINFARYRSVRLNACEDLVKRADDEEERLRNVKEKNLDLADKLQELKHKIESSLESSLKAIGTMAPPENINGENTTMFRRRHTLKQIHSYNIKLQDDLNNLKVHVESLMNEYRKYKDEKARLLGKIEDQQYLLAEKTNELERMRDYAQTDITLVRNIVEDLNKQLSEYNERIRTLEAQEKKLESMNGEVNKLEREFREMHLLIEEVSNQQMRESKAKEENDKLNLEVERLDLETKELDRQIGLKEQQLKLQQEKKDKVNQQYNEQERDYQNSIQLVIDEHTKLHERVKLKEQQYTSTKLQIQQLETTIRAQKASFAKEKKNVEIKLYRLAGIMRRYMDQIGNKLDAFNKDNL